LTDAVYICSAARTAIGNLNGGLSKVPAVELGGITIQAALERCGITPALVDECFMGCVLTGALGQGPARQAWLAAGGSESVPCTTVGKVCGSGLQSVIFAGRGLKLKEFDIAVAGGMENMSLASYALSVDRRKDQMEMSSDELTAMMIKDGLWDVYNDKHMGLLCDNFAAAEHVNRRQQDDFAVTSYRRALAAIEKGDFRWEIVPVDTGSTIFEIDEGPPLLRSDKLGSLKTAFNKENGSITAANASSINDGASAVVLAGEKAVLKHSLDPLARIVGWGSGALRPDRFPAAPVVAVENALSKAGLGIPDIDFWEINEAFAAVTIWITRELNLDTDRVNPLGGAVALGHPIGASGARILTTLLNVLRINRGRYGVATICIGGGEGSAVVIERV